MNAENETELFAIRQLEAYMIGPFGQLDMRFPEKSIQGKAEIHILTGENGTGKSTVLQMFANCVPNKRKLLHKKVAWPELTKYTILFSKQHLVTYNADLIIYKTERAPTDKEALENLKSKTFPDPLKRWVNNEDFQISTAFFAYSGYRKLSDSTVETIGDSTVNPFENALDFDKSTNTKTFVNWLATTITKNALALAKGSFEDQLRASFYKLPITQLEKVISDITNQQIRFELQESPLAILIHVDENPLEFDQLPDGLKSIISWLGDLIMRLDSINWTTTIPLTERNFILFLDEIEIHLHPSWQRKILPVVQQLFVNAQIFISTHSPFVVGSVDGAWVHRFLKDDKGYSQLQGEPILSEDSFSYEYILSEIFGVTERFGIEVERDLQEFKTIKNQILRNESSFDSANFEQLIQKLMSQSTEIQSIIGMELRQLSRLTNRTFA
jgi:energy-coupling factor transporter ATP-binding protein EcfA2